MQRILESKQSEIAFFKGEFKRLLSPENYEKLDKEGYLDDFAKMTVLLNDPALVTKQLNKLSNLLEKYLMEKGLIVEQNAKKSIKRKEGKDYDSNYKAFSTVIEKWAHENGFNQGGKAECKDKEGKEHEIDLPNHSPEILGFLSIFEFQFLMQYAFLFKDKAAMSAHGEFTHSLAIFVLTELNNEMPFLEHSILDLYKKIRHRGLQICLHTTYELYDVGHYI